MSVVLHIRDGYIGIWWDGVLARGRVVASSALQRKMNSLFSLHKSGHLSDYHYHKLRDSASHIALLYALPKIHKQDVSLRPIVTFVSSPTYSLSKHLVSILSPLVGNAEHYVCNSTDFAKFIIV